MRLVPFLFVLFTVVPAFAALSPKLEEWGEGPAQWLMTADEKRAWRKVATDGDGVNFIDLFWARRDPSPGTAVNEYRTEFDARVAFADEQWTEKRKRGAMTDRGRVYIVLGAATNMNTELRQSNATQEVSAPGGEASMRQRGGRDTWLWSHADAQKFGMPKIEVVFVEDPVTRRVQRDPRRADFGLAEARALKLAVVNPELTALPEWAAIGGLEPKGRVITVEVPMPIATPAAAPPAPQATAAAVPPVAGTAPAPGTTPGASRLTLRKGSIDARSTTDPFAVQSETTFPVGRDVPWAAQYCSANSEAPRVKYQLFMQGPLDGKVTEQRTSEKEAKPQPILAKPGCYVLQGMMPVSKLAPGRYRLSVFIDDVVTGGSHTLKTEFRLGS